MTSSLIPWVAFICVTVLTHRAHQLLHLPTDYAIPKLFLEAQGYEVTEKVVYRDSQS